MNWKLIPSTSAAQNLTTCNQCGECCKRDSCNFADVRDIRRVARFVGLTFRKFLEYVDIRIQDGKASVYMIHPCPFLKDNRCSIFKGQPKGAKEFSCWEAPKTYVWGKGELRTLGVK